MKELSHSPYSQNHKLYNLKRFFSDVLFCLYLEQVRAMSFLEYYKKQLKEIFSPRSRSRSSSSPDLTPSAIFFPQKMESDFYSKLMQGFNNIINGVTFKQAILNLWNLVGADQDPKKAAEVEQFEKIIAEKVYSPEAVLTPFLKPEPTNVSDSELAISVEDDEQPELGATRPSAPEDYLSQENIEKTMAAEMENEKPEVQSRYHEILENVPKPHPSAGKAAERLEERLEEMLAENMHYKLAAEIARAEFITREFLVRAMENFKPVNLEACHIYKGILCSVIHDKNIKFNIVGSTITVIGFSGEVLQKNMTIRPSSEEHTTPQFRR